MKFYFNVQIVDIVYHRPMVELFEYEENGERKTGSSPFIARDCIANALQVSNADGQTIAQKMDKIRLINALLGADEVIELTEQEIAEIEKAVLEVYRVNICAPILELVKLQKNGHEQMIETSGKN